MRKRTGVLLVAIVAIVFISHGISEAAHFNTGQRSFQISDTISTNLSTDCFDIDKSPETPLLIMPDSGEQNGDPVTVSYCWSATGSTHITGEGYTAVAGIGGTVSASSDCTTISHSAVDPATLKLTHNGNQTTVFSYPATVIQNNQTLSEPLTCSSFPAHIGDTMQGFGGVFAGLAGPTLDPGTSASFTFFFEASLPSAPVRAVPTMTEWGMIIFMVLAGLGSVYYLRRNKKIRS